MHAIAQCAGKEELVAAMIDYWEVGRAREGDWEDWSGALWDGEVIAPLALGRAQSVSSTNRSTSARTR